MVWNHLIKSKLVSNFVKILTPKIHLYIENQYIANTTN